MQNEPDRHILQPALIERCIRHLIYRSQTADTSIRERKIDVGKRLFAAEQSDGGQNAQSIGDRGLELDSLARIAAATAVARFFDLGTSGRDDYLYFEETLAGWSYLVAQHCSENGLDAKLVFETSGSTDSPKLVSKRLCDLLEETEALRASILPPGITRVIACVPPHHIYGFILTVLVPQMLHIPVHDTVFRNARSVLRNLDTGDLVVGTPFTWSSLMKAGLPFPSGVYGVSSAGQLSSDAWAKLAELGMSEMREVFGATETGGLGWRSDSAKAFRLFPHLRRKEEGIASRTSGVPLPLQDRVMWQDNDRFMPEGRVDHAIKVAGTTVSLEKVRSTLCALDIVADAAVRRCGERLKAFVVPADTDISPKDLSDKLFAHARAALAPPARPVSYSYGGKLPRNEMGKLCDW